MHEAIVSAVGAPWTQYRRVGHRRVPGWLQAQTLDVLAVLRDVQDELGVAGPVAEVGVYRGKLFIALQLLTPPATTAVAIDSFVDQSTSVHEPFGNLPAFESNVRRWGRWSSVAVKEADSTTLTASEISGLAGAPIRFFSVDGGHSEAVTVADLGNAEATIADGGVVIVDDIFNEQWPGVMDGVTKHFEAGSTLIPFGIGFNKTYFTNSESHAAGYRAALGERFGDDVRIYHKTTEFRGHKVEILMRQAVTPRTVLRRQPWARAVYFGIRSRVGR